MINIVIALLASMTPQEGVSFEQKRLATVPESTRSVKFSSDGRRAAYVHISEGKSHLVVNGKNGKPFDFIVTFGFSPDGKRIAFLANDGGKRPETAIEGFSWFIRGGSWFVVVDGEKGKGFDCIGFPEWSPDSRIVAFSANRGGKFGELPVLEGGKNFSVVGGRAGKEYGASVGDPVFSPDGKTVAYVVHPEPDWARDSRAFVVVGETPGEGFELIMPMAVSADGRVHRGLVFSPDGKRIAYPAATSLEPKRWHMVVDGRTGKAFQRTRFPVFSPNSSTLAYAAEEDNKWYMMVGDEKRGKGVDRIGAPVFSPDGSKVAYLANRGATRGGRFNQPSGGKFFVVVGKEKGKEFDLVRQPVFHPDGGIVAYAANIGGEKQEGAPAVKGGEWFVVAGDKTGEKFDWVGDPVFGPKGRRIAYRANRDGQIEFIEPSGGDWWIVVGDKKSERYDQVWTPLFSPDGRKVAFGARKGREVWWKVLAVE